MSSRNGKEIWRRTQTRTSLGGYFKKAQNNNFGSSYYSMRHLEGNSMNFLAAATNTVRTTILWNLCIAASDPDGHQARAQREIDAVLGQDKAPAWEDRHRLPYIMATVLETLRWRTVAPLGKRGCPGETVALTEAFLYVATLLQKFRVLPEEGKTMSLDVKDCLMAIADDTQKLRFIPR
ncbi:hypothetical protein MTO96_002078 [Rhipicephalus appendiculatus]